MAWWWVVLMLLVLAVVVLVVVLVVVVGLVVLLRCSRVQYRRARLRLGDSAFELSPKSS